MTDTFDIQKLVQKSGVPRRTIYFYVQQGVLPPPEGAGLAAFYTGEHLLRLQMIPLLRREGLRLDEIRQRLGQMSAGQMRQRLEESGGLTTPPRPGKEILPAISGWQEKTVVQYQLPGGVVVTAPADLAGEAKRRLQRLLLTAAQIYQLSGAQEASDLTPLDGQALTQED